jgi:hypothetical protein
MKISSERASIASIIFYGYIRLTRIISYHHQVILSAGVVVRVINLVVLLCLLCPDQVIIGKEGECGLKE